MDTRSSVWLMRGPVVFSAPDGQAIEGAADSIELFFEDGELSVCDLTFHISAEAYGRVSTQELFQLAASVRGPGSGSFRPAGMVTIEARLANQFLPLISTGSEEAEVAAQALQSAPADSPLRSAQSWYALHVTEEVELPDGLEGSLLSGYSTTWADEDDNAGGETSLLGIITAYLDQEEWDYVALPDKPGVAFRFAGTNLEWDCFVVADEATGMVLMYSVSPKRVPAERRAAAAEYITRANWAIPSGNFEMDYEDGDVRFKTGIDVDEAALTANLFDHIAEANIVAMNTYIGGLLAVIEGTEPKLALAQAEAAAAAE
jgi:hypothetical protein